MNKKNIGLYIHVPFCEKKCPYCDFYSVISNETLLDEYTDKICKELTFWSKKINRSANTLYFGGGSPNLLGVHRLERIIKEAQKSFGLFYAEITIEINPVITSFDFEKLFKTGVNRLSIGIQSINDQELQLLGRSHTAKTATKTILTAQKSGFKNISIDLMIATPSQNKKSLLESITFCSEINIQHVSAYLLKIENNTPFFLNKSTLKIPNEDEQNEMYLMTCNELQKRGFQQYEISNFAKFGFESSHNLKYWNAEEYLGLGPSAHSFIDKKRFFFPKALQNLKPTQDGLGGNEEEYCMLRFRLSAGLINEEYKKRFGHNIPKKIIQNAYKYRHTKLIHINNKDIKFTPRGFLVSNELISKIVL